MILAWSLAEEGSLEIFLELKEINVNVSLEVNCQQTVLESPVLPLILGRLVWIKDTGVKIKSLL